MSYFLTAQRGSELRRNLLGLDLLPFGWRCKYWKALQNLLFGWSPECTVIIQRGRSSKHATGKSKSGQNKTGGCVERDEHTLSESCLEETSSSLQP